MFGHREVHESVDDPHLPDFLAVLVQGKQVVTPNLDELELGFGEEPPLVHLHLVAALVLEPEERGDREVKGLEALETKHAVSSLQLPTPVHSSK